jgi:hypothetical protein
MYDHQVSVRAHALELRSGVLIAACLACASGCGRGSVLLLQQDVDDGGSRPPAPACDGSESVFASEVLRYTPELSGFPPTHPDVLDPEDALGPPDYTSEDGYPGYGSVSLGQGGRLELLFVECWLANDLTPSPDLRVYEVGPAVEGLTVSLRARPQIVDRLDPARRIAGDEPWFRVGEIGGGVTDIDLEAMSDGAAVFFDAVRFDDDPLQGTGTELAWGADIDAVELLSTVDP